MLVHLIALDHVAHRLGRDNPVALRAVAAADRAVARVVETVERLGLLERTTFIVTGDHGSVDVHTTLLPNVWLRDAGLLGPSAASVAASANASWRAVFHASGGSAFLRIHPSAEAGTLASARAMLEALPRGVRALFRVVERAELDALGADPDAALALTALAGVVFSTDREGAPTQVAHGAGHGYHPEMPDMMTGLVAAGAGIRAGAVIPMLPMQHVAPLVATLLGLDLPDVDGTLLPGVLAIAPESR